MEQGSPYLRTSPNETPYRTPSSSLSRRSRPYDDRSPASTPPPLPTDHFIKRRSNDSSDHLNDEAISPLDPRRFTPTLHASLVSEILSLRRELETRTKDVERLETNLVAAQSQSDALGASLSSSNREARVAKRQLQYLEQQSAALHAGLQEERDAALTGITDLQRKLEQAQRRAITSEDNAERTQIQWEKEKEVWYMEKRGLENKVFITEGRLKIVVEELERTHTKANGPLSPELLATRPKSILGSPGKASILSQGTRRCSQTSIYSEYGANPTQPNLADELNFDGGADVVVDEMGNQSEDGRSSPDALPEEKLRPHSSLSTKARKVLGLGIISDDAETPFHTAREMIIASPSTPEPTPKVILQYVDCGVQYSPPPSPKQVSGDDKVAPLRISLDTSRPPFVSHRQRNSIYSERGVPEMDETASCRTLPSPPLTPERLEPDRPLSFVQPLPAPTMVCTGTQTEIVKDQKSLPSEDGESEVPAIAIIPPASRPMTPETKVVLPPRTKNAGSQVKAQDLQVYKSRSMQTEEIRVDLRNIVAPSQARPLVLSRHFRPPGSSRDLTRLVPSNATTSSSSRYVRTRSPTKGLSSNTVRDKILSHRGSNLSQRSTSPVPELESHIEEDQDALDANDFDDDDDIFNRPIARYTLRSGKLVSQDLEEDDIEESLARLAGQAAAFEQMQFSRDILPSESKAQPRSSRASSPKKSYPHAARTKQLKRVNSIRSANIIKAASNTGGTLAQQLSLSRDPDAANNGVKPPFPVPLRYSSARIGKSVSEGGRSSPGSTGASPTRKSKHRKVPVLRKARSGPAISPHGQTRRKRSASPPFDSQVSIVPDMPSFQMPATNSYPFLAEPYTPPPQTATSRYGPTSGATSRTSHVRTESDNNNNTMQQTSVVDAIAQTMVGEWMYKYVRRRKSFGVTDKSNDWDPNKNIEELTANVTSTGVRHKRWVWVAPYERTVMWSSKQPMSNSALMGKNGRKLVINSVLDVRDDNPMPKNAVTGPQFNRSIIILTPERALKFTATSQERHFVWLTALSFLSHSPLSVDDLISVQPQEEVQKPSAQPAIPSTATSRRRPLRDSIRIAKDPKRTGVVFPDFDSMNEGPAREDVERAPSRSVTSRVVVDPALPPTIRRFATRERSNTGPTVPQNSLRGLMSRAPAIPGLSRPGSSNVQTTRPPTAISTSERAASSLSQNLRSRLSSRRASDASGSGALKIPYPANTEPQSQGQPQPPFNSTMRMQAFVENNQDPPRTRYYRSSGTEKKLPPRPYEKGRVSVSPVDFLLHAEIRAATRLSTRGSAEARDPFRNH